MIELITAMTANSCIGLNNKLPWNKLRGDMMFFKRTTTDKAVIMGRVTFESLGNKPLPNRVNIVISRTLEKVEGIEIAESLEEAIEIALKHEKTPIIIGGGSIYDQALDLVDVMYLTSVDTMLVGDTYFPPIEFYDWNQEVVEIGEAGEDNRNDFNYTIYKMTRKNVI